MRELTANSKALLVALLEHEEGADPVAAQYGMTANDIGRAMGFRDGGTGGRGMGGRGRGHRVFGPAQKIIPTLNGLRGRDLIDFGPRRDGRSGTAYSLTVEGHLEAHRQRDAGVKAKVPR